MEIIGYIASALIGLSLGLIGGGGSILTVPVLVYLFGVGTIDATAYSLFIVGATSLVGSWSKYKEGNIDLKTAMIFGAPSIIAVYATRKYLVPAIPDEIFPGFSKTVFVMTLFAVLMLAASISMIRDKKAKTPTQPKENNLANSNIKYLIILLEGLVVGGLTGLVGAGGGFLIIPALVLLTGLSMKVAVGTSLLIIATKSLIGFTGDLGNMDVDWTFLGIITAIAIVGIFAGNALSKKIDGGKLKKGFGWFVLVMGIYILVKELFLQ
ncbi:MAG: sulfite exporter TauE/SafE family protein [Luteibaculaceae bacterium]